MAIKWCKIQAPNKCLLNWKIYFGKLTKKLMPLGRDILFQHIFSHVHHKYSSQHKLYNMQEKKITSVSKLFKTPTPRLINLIFWWGFFFVRVQKLKVGDKFTSEYNAFKQFHIIMRDKCCAENTNVAQRTTESIKTFIYHFKAPPFWTKIASG